MWNHFFQLLPVFLACIASVTCARRFNTGRRKQDKLVMALATVCSLMLIIAQTSWWTTYIVDGNLLGTVFANTIWTIFNTLIMVTLIIVSDPFKK
jgi:hypothetical protein